MARLLKDPVKKRTLKGLRRGMRLTYQEPLVRGRTNRKVGGRINRKLR